MQSHLKPTKNIMVGDLSETLFFCGASYDSDVAKPQLFLLFFTEGIFQIFA